MRYSQTCTGNPNQVVVDRLPVLYFIREVG